MTSNHDLAHRRGRPRSAEAESAGDFLLVAQPEQVPFGDSQHLGEFVVRVRSALRRFAGDPVVSGLTSTTYQIFFGATTSRGSGTATGTPQAERRTIARPLPKTTASIDAWALVVD